MRKLIGLMLVLSGLQVGCGGSDSSGGDKDTSKDPAMGADGTDGNGSDGNGSDGNSTDGNGGDGISIPDAGSTGGNKYPDCPRDQIPATSDAYMGDKPFSQADFMACQKKCGQDAMCFNETNCPGFDKFNECANTEIVGCSAKQGGKCRTQYEDFLCCANASGCQADDTNCVQTKCAADIMAMQTCIQNDQGCFAPSLQQCFGDDTSTPPADADAGAGGAGGGTTDPGNTDPVDPGTGAGGLSQLNALIRAMPAVSAIAAH